MWPAASTVVTAAIVKATTSRFGPISPDNPSIRPCSICAAVSAESLPASTAGEAAVAEPEQQRRGQRYFLTALTRPINESDGLHVNYRARSQRDLETICLKCMEKEPKRRYGSARELAEELHCHLAGKPIHSRPVTRTERLWRWCNRQPLVAGLVSAIVLTLLSGTAVSLYFAITATAQRQRADVKADEARLEKDRANQKAAEALMEKERANQSATEARAEKERANQNAVEARTEKVRVEEQRRRADEKTAERSPRRSGRTRRQPRRWRKRNVPKSSFCARNGYCTQLTSHPRCTNGKGMTLQQLGVIWMPVAGTFAAGNTRTFIRCSQRTNERS